MAEISRSGEAAGGSSPSGRAREGSSRPPPLLRVGETPWRAPPTAAGGRGRNGEDRNLCHPLSTDGKVGTEKKGVRSDRSRERKKKESEAANSGYNSVFSFPGDSDSFSAILLTYKTQQDKHYSMRSPTADQTVL